jgi:sulfur carrier protein
MITIRLNEQPCVLERERTLIEVLQKEGFTTHYFAVALNKKFIPRTEYENIFLKDGDCVDVVSPMQGG